VSVHARVALPVRKKKIVPNTSLFAALVLTLLSLSAQAADRHAGLYFSHNDWELACDNTGTCRAAGYQSDDDESTVSVLLTRKAGPRQPVTAELMIGDYNDEDVLSDLPAGFKVSMRIDGQELGPLSIRKDTLTAVLSAPQADALLAALPRTGSIEWRAGEHRWRLSGKGAAAVLLKMDDFQGRLGTPGALIKKGTLSEDKVLAPLPTPVMIAAPLIKPRPGDEALAGRILQALRQSHRATDNEDDCPDLMEDGGGKGKLAITRLTDTRLLVSTQCWAAAYNAGDGYWVVDDAPPYRAVPVTTYGTDYSGGIISASQKVRGLGDCFAANTWTWDGKQFVHTEASTTGMCKLIAPGGAWSLPTLVTDVRHTAR
jgi:invasion protein IalB